MHPYGSDGHPYASVSVRWASVRIRMGPTGIRMEPYRSDGHPYASVSVRRVRRASVCIPQFPKSSTLCTLQEGNNRCGRCSSLHTCKVLHKVVTPLRRCGWVGGDKLIYPERASNKGTAALKAASTNRQMQQASERTETMQTQRASRRRKAHKPTWELRCHVNRVSSQLLD